MKAHAYELYYLVLGLRFDSVLLSGVLTTNMIDIFPSRISDINVELVYTYILLRSSMCACIYYMEPPFERNNRATRG